MLTAVVVSVAGPWRRAQAVALNIVVIHLVGDVPSPLLIGWVSDLASLKWGVSLTLVALAAGAVLIFSALPHLKGDLAAAGEIDLQDEPSRIRFGTPAGEGGRERPCRQGEPLGPHGGIIISRAAAASSLFYREQLMNPRR